MGGMGEGPFLCLHGVILETFWGNLEFENRLGGHMEAPFSLELDFLGSTSPIFAGFH